MSKWFSFQQPFCTKNGIVPQAHDDGSLFDSGISNICTCLTISPIINGPQRYNIENNKRSYNKAAAFLFCTAHINFFFYFLESQDTVQRSPSVLKQHKIKNKILKKEIYNTVLKDVYLVT